MRYLYARLVGYIGIYNGLGINNIEIEFTRCKNKITVISGPNGVGKSTIINALSLMPDGNECFVPSMNASKEIKLTDGNNIYEIVINHPIDKNGNRGNTKASILKNGVELNSNGNISSYKDIIFAEFDIDANYMALSKISGNNRGLADKKPAERKKILSSIIYSLEFYNNIYKNFNKKANIFKSHINALSSKIQSVGDENNLRSAKVSFDISHNRIQEIIDKTKEQITECKTIISMSDPKGTMQQEYQSIKNEIEFYRQEKDKKYNELAKFIDNNCLQSVSNKEISVEIDKIQSSISIQREEYTKTDTEAKMMLEMINSISSDITKLEVKISNIGSDIDTDILNKIEEYSNKVKNIESACSRLGIKNMEDITKEEIELMISTVNRILMMLDHLYENMSTDQFEQVYQYLSENIDIEADINGYIDNVEQLEKIRIDNREELIKIVHDIESVSILENRPKNCHDDRCYFICSALDIIRTYGKSVKDIEKIRDDKKKYESELTKTINMIKLTIDKKKEIRNILSKLVQIMDLIESNASILSKFSITAGFMDRIRFLDLIRRESRFNKLRDLNQYMDLANSITEYKTNLSILHKLQSKLEINQNNIKILNEYQEEIDRKIKERQEKNEEYDKMKSSMEFTSKLILANTEKLELYNQYKVMQDQLEISKQNYEDICKKSAEIESKFNSCLDILKKIEELERVIQSNMIELQSIEEQRKTIDTQLALLDSFKSEYEIYKEKYDYVDKLRTYSSPTKKGIQSLFMSIYMDKTLSMVNQLLGMMFGGQYKMLNYVINEDEFRLPFVGNGLTVDDISSGSTSQVCIMGMIINLVLANSSSSKYNIVSLDEIDGGLDHINRYLFVDVLQKICDILNIDQLFIISHSVESALNNVDVILLSGSQEYIDQFSHANIIYQFHK